MPVEISKLTTKTECSCLGDDMDKADDVVKLTGGGADVDDETMGIIQRKRQSSPASSLLFERKANNGKNQKRSCLSVKKAFSLLFQSRTSTMTGSNSNNYNCDSSSNNTSNRIVTTVCLVCALWVLGYMLLGGNDPGRSFYANTASVVLGDPKGGLPILHLAVPILLAGSIASLGWTLSYDPLVLRNSNNNNDSHRLNSNMNNHHNHHDLLVLPSFWHRWRHRLECVQGDRNMDVIAMSLILMPGLVFVAMCIYRKVHVDKALSLDETMSTTSNSFGMMAEVVGSFLLIPVARHSSLLHVVGWSPARAVRLHIWAGRIFIVAVLIHGSMHMMRWTVLAQEPLMGMLFPPALCWTLDRTQYTSKASQPVCIDDDTDCTCYDIFRNLTGFLSGVAIVVILVTSLHPVRRQFYKLFYVSHIIAAPLAIIFLVLHWNRSIVFIAPSLIYYTASSFPVLVETYWTQQPSTNNNNSMKGVKVASVELIPSTTTNSSKKAGGQYISLTVEATEVASQRFRPGYYIQLLAPEVSSISHPFTVNLVPGKSHQLRIIWKVSGEFTSKLSQRIQQALSGSTDDCADTFPKNTMTANTVVHNKMPIMHVHGYLGIPNRVAEVLKHDVAIMIAGGIGITPYLTLIHHVHGILSNATTGGAFATKRIVLLWLCRDASLVEYVRREYLEPLLQQARDQNDKNHAGFKIKFIIYHTGSENLTQCRTFTDNDEENVLATRKNATKSMAMYPTNSNDSNKEDVMSLGVPFSPSRFSTGSSSSVRANILCFLAFSGIAWMGFTSTWWLYKYGQVKEEVASRIWSMVALPVIGVGVAVVVNFLAGLPYFQREDDVEETRWAALPAIRQDMDGGACSASIEMEAVHSDDALTTIDDWECNEDGSENAGDVVTLEEKQGRPTVHQMLRYVDNGKHPGLFTCGPVRLMQDIRENTEERCLLRLQQCVRGASHRIALYEEAFEM